MSNPTPLANVPFPGQSGATQLYLKDVAEVVVDHQPMVGDGIVNDGPGLLLIVEKFPWGNTLQVTRESRRPSMRFAPVFRMWKSTPPSSVRPRLSRWR